MGFIYVDQINFEFEETPNYHDILLNSGLGTQTIAEVRQTVAHIYVDIVNLLIPVSEVVAEICVNHCTNTPSIEEVIVGTPVEEPAVAVGGGVSSTMEVMGGRPWSEEDIYASASNLQVIEEAIYVADTLEVMAALSPAINAKIRRPIYAKPREVEITSYVLDDKKVTVVEQSNQGFTRKTKKDEEELILLGII